MLAQLCLKYVAKGSITLSKFIFSLPKYLIVMDQHKQTTLSF